MPLILADAADYSPLLYWAVVDEIVYDEESGVTTCSYHSMQPIKGERPLSSLVLRTGKPLSDEYIRPYAICRTPPFLAG